MLTCQRRQAVRAGILALVLLGLASPREGEAGGLLRRRERARCVPASVTRCWPAACHQPLVPSPPQPAACTPAPDGFQFKGNTFYEADNYYHWYSDVVGQDYCGPCYFQVNKPAIVSASRVGVCPDGRQMFDILLAYGQIAIIRCAQPVSSRFASSPNPCCNPNPNTYPRYGYPVGYRCAGPYFVGPNGQYYCFACLPCS